MLECVVNVSEGRDADVTAAISSAGGAALIDLHTDSDHHRSVLTLAGSEVERSARSVARAAVEMIDLRRHSGAHPRLGVVDVVPFAPLTGSGSEMAEAVAARARFASWAGSELGLPCFLYGPERSLPEVRRSAFRGLSPDEGPARPHPSAGATAVGARPVLVAYNLWLAGSTLEEGRLVAKALRRADVRALAFDLGGEVQLSFNLLDPLTTGPSSVYDMVAARARVARSELVGLAPEAVLHATPRERWEELDLSPAKTIEARLAATKQRAPGPRTGPPRA